jgi:hypothetical protein
MSEPERTEPFRPKTHPRCTSCGVPMWLIRSVRSSEERAHQYFECKACDAKTEVTLYE